ncbi:hypothetical protein [Amycolatopsis thermophila]|uniref:HicA toxin of toxin-antitoxin n=1 Tax=Amycolatopsis thermophila TaxID=206084 RepID=A0ABU0EMU0_9PSEU|nr:hypothetical protein [Amycolatopsis thermophila]MDQ0376587.1 hypothetical protein [Amycolatopsis thermophila]
MGREDELEKLIAWAESQGWTVKTDKKGYRHFYNPAGDWVVRHPATPGNPRRRLAEVQTALKRNGLEVPPPSRAEQRRRARKEAD